MKSTWILRSLHVALGLSLPLVLLFLMGCKRAKEEKADLGTLAAATEIDEALHKAVSGRTLRTLHVGQFVDYSITRRIENNEMLITLGALNVNVIKEEDLGNTMKYILQINKSYRNDRGGFQTVTTEEPLVLQKSANATAAAAGVPSRVSELTASAARVRASEDRPIKKVTYHKLKYSEGTLPVSDRLRARAGCGGLNPCEFPVRSVSFDVAFWYSDDDYDKIRFEFAYSVATPWLPFGDEDDFFTQTTGLLVSDCRSAYVKVEDRNVYVRDCQQLEDLQK